MRLVHWSVIVLVLSVRWQNLCVCMCMCVCACVRVHVCVSVLELSSFPRGILYYTQHGQNIDDYISTITFSIMMFYNDILKVFEPPKPTKGMYNLQLGFTWIWL